MEGVKEETIVSVLGRWKLQWLSSAILRSLGKYEGCHGRFLSVQLAIALTISRSPCSSRGCTLHIGTVQWG